MSRFCRRDCDEQGGVQPTGEDLGRLTMLAAPAADGWRWARPYPKDYLIPSGSC